MPLHTIYRPTVFSEMFGNKSTLESLSSAVRRNKDRPHSYLFTGPAGTGKSSCSKILKNELGCSDHDVYFYNASAKSDRGIDATQSIIDSAKYSPLSGDCKLFIIEEAHQLTKPAQESLLVLLEEPPKHVFFAICTTEPEKLKASFKRRCHKTELQPLDTQEITDLLSLVLEKEGIKDFPEEVIIKISDSCDGSPGQALNLLDTVIDIEDDATALAAIENSVVSEASIAEIARALLSSKAKWSSIAEMIKGLQGEPESLRYAFLGYFQAVLLNKGDAVVASMLMPFTESVMYSGKPGLTLAIYLAWVESKE